MSDKNFISGDAVSLRIHNFNRSGYIIFTMTYGNKKNALVKSSDSNEFFREPFEELNYKKILLIEKYNISLSDLKLVRR